MTKRCLLMLYHYLVVGDFNSHSQSWGYDHIEKRGKEVENWQDDHKLNLINKLEDQPTFYSIRWRTTSTPDLAFCTDDIDGQITREVREQLGGSVHRPVLLISPVNQLCLDGIIRRLTGPYTAY